MEDMEGIVIDDFKPRALDLTRDARGRILAGPLAAPSPSAWMARATPKANRHLADLRSAMREEASVEDIKDIMRKAIEDAKEGNQQARQFVFTALFGQARNDWDAVRVEQNRTVINFAETPTDKLVEAAKLLGLSV